jgi:predicted NBD/HSP70 family sugar kinase
MAMQISRRAAAGEERARAAYSVLAGYLAEGVANLFNILDPEAVILSGGLSEGNDSFIDEVQVRVQSLLHFGEKRRPKLLRAAACHYAGVQGAAATVFAGNGLE